jgi:hypothetical protein
MQRTDFANNDLQRSEYEAACRDFWSAFVLVETGRRPDDGNSVKERGLPSQRNSSCVGNALAATEL